MKELIQELAGLVYEFNEVQTGEGYYPNMALQLNRYHFDILRANGQGHENVEWVAEVATTVTEDNLKLAIDKVRGML